MKEIPTKQYLGDSVYADFQRGMVVLTTENGYGATNTIFLEPEVIRALNKYNEWLQYKEVVEE